MKAQARGPEGPRESIFGEVSPLPRGPHNLSRRHVAESQRTRLLAALVDVVAAKGYRGTTITEVVKRARVSPNAFYEYFADLESCFVTAYDVFAATLAERVGGAALSQGDWRATVAGALEAYLGTLEDDPVAARVFLIEFEAVGPAARRKRHEVFAAFAQLINDQHDGIRAQDPTLGPLPYSVYFGFVLAVRALACEVLERDDGPGPRSLAPDLLVWFLATIEGAAGPRP